MACWAGRRQPAANPRGQCPIAHWPPDGAVQSALPHLTPCSLFFASLTQSCPRGREQSPCLCPCQVLAEGGGGDRKPGVGRGRPWPFPFPSSQVSSLSGRSLFLAPPSPPSLTPLPPFPRWRARVKGVLSGADCTPRRGVMGTPTKHSFCPVHLDTHTHTHSTIPRTKEKASPEWRPQAAKPGPA